MLFRAQLCLNINHRRCSAILHLDKNLLFRRKLSWQDSFMINSGDMLSPLLITYFIAFAHESRPCCIA